MYSGVLILYACVLITEVGDTRSIRLTGGPHGLPREVVSGIQRGRLFDAMASVTAAEGYEGATVRRLTTRAGVSRKTYYELFGDKEECFLAAYDEAIGRLIAAVVEACAEAGAAADRPDGGVAAALAFLAAEQDVARMCVVAAPAGGPRVRARRAATLDRLALMLAAARTGRPEPARSAIRSARLFVGGVCDLVHGLLDRDDLDGLAGRERLALGLAEFGEDLAGRERLALDLAGRRDDEDGEPLLEAAAS